MTDNGGFKIDGVAASTYGVILMYAPGQPMLPGTKDRTASVLGRAGDIWIDSDLNARIFSLPCQFRDCETASELDILIRAFARIFVHVRGKPRQLELEFDDAPGLKYLVRYNGEIPFDRAWVGCSDFTLNLIADDPYAYEPEDKSTHNITTSGISGVTVTSSGNVETPAEFCITNNGVADVDGFTIKVNYEVT